MLLEFIKGKVVVNVEYQLVNGVYFRIMGVFVMSKAEYKNINITNLLLNPTNPRHNPVEHQTECIEAIVVDQREKLIALAQHIIEYGMNPIDFILVKPEGKQWVVREGNRRVTALKLLNEPQLTPKQFPKIKKAFTELNKIIDKSIFKNIPCASLTDEDKINEWVRLKHTGQNEGAGTVGWDGLQTSRFRGIVEGKPDARIAFLDYLSSLPSLPSGLGEKIYSIKKTNFDRLMGDPDVRNFLGVKVKDNQFFVDNNVISKALLLVLTDLASGKLSVGKIYHKEDREEYINKINQKLEKDESDKDLPQNEDEETPDNNKSRSEDVDTEKTENEAEDDVNPENNDVDDETDKEVEDEPGNSDSKSKKKTKRPPSYPINRKTLVPSHHKLTISQSRLLKIFNELKTLSVDDYPNAVSVLFRAFMEMSADQYIEDKKMTNGKLNVDSKLSVKIDSIATHMIENKILTEHQLRAIRQMTSSPSQTQSIKTFHSYVHNKNVTPSSTDLKSAWDDVWMFIEKIWS